jgi:MFS family permease
MIKSLTDLSLFRAWANRSFVLLWNGQALSRIGDHLYQVALAWWVLQETGSAGAMATVLIFALAPTVLFALYGGVLVDRYPRLPILIGSDVVRGLTFFASALFMLPLLRAEVRPLPSVTRQSLLTDFWDGLDTVRKLPWLWISICLFALSNVALVGPYSVAMPFLVKDVLHAEVGVLGLLYAMFAVGYVLGGVWLGRRAVIRRRGPLLMRHPAIRGLD